MKTANKKKRKTLVAFATTLITLATVSTHAYAAGTDRYNVQPGDSLWEISNKYKVKLEKVIEANPQFTNPNLIYPNDIVMIPLGGETNSGEIGATWSDSYNRSNINAQTNTGYAPNAGTQVRAMANPSINEVVAANMINYERTQHGLKPLQYAEDIANVARIKSEEMSVINYFGHNSPHYGNPSEMLKQLGINYTYAGEIIAKGQRSSNDAVSAWMNSSEHRANILNPNYNEIGIGYVLDESGTAYWTAQFVAR